MRREGMAEIASSRVLSATGYYSRQMSLAAFAQVQGAGKRSQLNGRRFTRLDPDIPDVFPWDLKNNSLNQSRELDGLRALLALLGLRSHSDDWLKVAQAPAEPQLQIFYVADLRFTLGNGEFPSTDFAKEKQFLEAFPRPSWFSRQSRRSAGPRECRERSLDGPTAVQTIRLPVDRCLQGGRLPVSGDCTVPENRSVKNCRTHRRGP